MQLILLIWVRDGLFEAEPDESSGFRSKLNGSIGEGSNHSTKVRLLKVFSRYLLLKNPIFLIF